MSTIVTSLFLLQLFSFAVMFILYTRIQKNEKLYEEQRELVEQFEQSMQVYLEEIRADNDRLVEQLRASRSAERQDVQLPSTTPSRSPVDELLQEVEQLERAQPIPTTYGAHLTHQILREQSKKVTAPRKSTSPTEEVPPLTPSSPSLEERAEPQEDVQEETFEQRVRRLHEEGQTIEQLARQFNRGTTEIELLLKFSS